MFVNIDTCTCLSGRVCTSQAVLNYNVFCREPVGMWCNVSEWGLSYSYILLQFSDSPCSASTYASAVLLRQRRRGKGETRSKITPSQDAKRTNNTAGTWEALRFPDRFIRRGFYRIFLSGCEDSRAVFCIEE